MPMLRLKFQRVNIPSLFLLLKCALSIYRQPAFILLYLYVPTMKKPGWAGTHPGPVINSPMLDDDSEQVGNDNPDAHDNGNETKVPLLRCNPRNHIIHLRLRRGILDEGLQYIYTQQKAKGNE